jgi:hypothetical protein
MNNTWKTGAAPSASKAVQWPTPVQWGKQLGLILAIVLVWGGALVAFLQLTATPADDAQPPQNEAAAAPTEPPSPTHMSSPEPSPPATDTPEPPSATEAAPPAASAPVEPSPTATHTPSPEPIATNTPEPPSPTPPPADAGGVSFANDVLPIFEQRCVKCHGGEKTEEGLVLTNYADTLAGGWNGTVIEPGNVAETYLIEQIESGEMPKNEPRLLPSEIRIITEWVAAGAPDN